MLSSRFVSLLVILLAVQGWCKPAKSTEGEEYSDDDPPSDYNDDDIADGDGDDPSAFEEPPQIMSDPVSRHVRSGSTIKLPCLVKNTDNVLVTWKKGKELLYSDSNAITKDNERIIRMPDNTLVIYNATVGDSSDDYECSIITDPPLMIRHRVLVDAERAPVSPSTHKSVIHVSPGKKVEVSAGESVTLGCEVRMQPLPEIKWFHENKRLNDSVAVNGSHVTIRNISRHQGGLYQCLAENGSNNPPVEAIHVVVNYAPEIEAKKGVVHTGLGVESDLTCIVHAHPHAKVKWYKGQREIVPESGRIAIKVNKTVHVLEILRTEQEDLGEYVCAATNKMGRAEKTVSLTGAPSQATIYGGEMTRAETGLILKWRLESYSPITEYRLDYRRKGEEKWNEVKPTVTNGKGNQFVVEHPIEGLQPGSYEAILMARNDFGWSEPSAPHTFTGEYAVEEAENVKGSASTAQPFGVTIALFLVVLSGAFRSL